MTCSQLGTRLINSSALFPSLLYRREEIEFHHHHYPCSTSPRVGTYLQKLHRRRHRRN